MMLEADVDLLSLRAAALPALIDTLERLVTDHAGAAVLNAVAELAVDETVRLVRSGSRSEVIAGGKALSGFLASKLAQAAQDGAPGAHDTLNGLLPVLTAAASPASKDGGALVLRSWSGKAREALEHIASTPKGVLGRAELRTRLAVSESYLSHLLADLEAAHLVERISAQGARTVEVHLAPQGREFVTPPPARPVTAQRLRKVARVRACELTRRLDALGPDNGASIRFRKCLEI
jgi:DNA-binding MarR family transcriptional regulator